MLKNPFIVNTLAAVLVILLSCCGGFVSGLVYGVLNNSRSGPIGTIVRRAIVIATRQRKYLVAARLTHSLVKVHIFTGKRYMKQIRGMRE